MPSHDNTPPSALPGWLAPAVLVVLCLAAIIVILRPGHREEDIVVRNFTERADALIWALEAGTRTWMGNLGDNETLQKLVEETAKQPGLDYIAVTDDTAAILSHSDPEHVGKIFPLALPDDWRDLGKQSLWRVRTDGDAPVFEVRRQFIPIASDQHAFSNYRRHGRHGGMMGMGMGGMGNGRGMGMRGMGMGMGCGHGGRMDAQRQPPPEESPGRKSYVFVGMDYAPVADALNQDRHRRLLTSLVAGLLGAGGLLGLVWYRGHLRSRRILAAAREEIERGKRLTALGNLAAGVAHEIRNPLSSIKGLATYLSRHVPEGAPRDAADTMAGEVDRLNRVVSGLLDFAKPGAMKRAPTDVNDVVHAAIRLADADIRAKNISARFTPAPGLGPVSVNRERLTQALLNLFLNAVQAMREGGVLHVEVSSRAGGQRFAIRVQDDGDGMPEEVQASIFTPYYTTKSSGTGLGLAIVHQIVEGHGGVITVESSPGRGSAFTLDFPAAPPEEIAAQHIA